MRWQAGVFAGVGAALLAVGCSSGSTGPTGTVTGTYIRVGGPEVVGSLGGTSNVPLSGTVSFEGQGGKTITLNSDSKGKFTGRLPVGTYTVTAKSSMINSGASTCSRPMTTRVLATKTVTLTIICDIP